MVQATDITVGFITFGALTAPYLSSFIESLGAQTIGRCRIVAFDNTPEAENPNADVLRAAGIAVRRSPEGNIGFSRAYNVLIKEAAANGSKYMLVINPDTLLNADVIEQLAIALDADDTLGSACPKLLRWDFKNHRRTDTIDSAGLGLRSGLRFIDIGQGESDSAAFDTAQCLGPSGAAGLFRISALAAVAEAGSYFDEHFPLYKEDCDVAYRLHLAGFGSRLVSRAVVYHDRTASGGSLWKRIMNRRQRSRSSRRSAFIGDHLLWIKFWKTIPVSGKAHVLLRACLRFAAALVEPYTLSAYRDIVRLSKTLLRY